MIEWFLSLSGGTQAFLFIMPFVVGIIGGLWLYSKMYKTWKA